MALRSAEGDAGRLAEAVNRGLPAPGALRDRKVQSMPSLYR